MKICLIKPPKFENLGHMTMLPSPPLGLAYIAAALESANHVVTVIDSIGESPEQFVPFKPAGKFLEEHEINWRAIVSKRLFPDDSIYVIVNNTLFIIECKFQQVAGSVDEKLQTCDFKKKQYQKLLFRANIEVEYIYLLGDWFKNPSYKDVLDYIISVGCHFYFEYIPLEKLGLPMPLKK